MKKLFIILTITLFACNHTTAQGLAKLVGKVASQQSEDKEDKDRYKKIDFSVANSEGQLLYYSILPEGNNTVALVKMDGKKNRYDELHYTIPSNVSFNGTNYTVTEIGDETFDRCKVTSVNLPSTIRKIGAFAFFSSKLNTITIPGSVKSIGRGAFFANESLISITLNEGLEEIGDEAFRCTSITTAIIPNSVKKIGIQAFSCKALQELFVPDNLRNIGDNAFAGAKGVSNYFMYKGMISNLPSWITVSNCKKYGISKDAFNAYHNTKLAQQQATPQVVYLQAPTVQAPPNASKSENQRENPSSDVDINIPENAINNETTFAIIIANENYQEESKVEYALNDGETFKTYCQKTLGLPEDNIHYKKDATLNNILSEVDWLSQVAKAYNGEANLIVYYAGHGIPDETNGSAYLLPIDGKGTNLRTGYSLAELYKTLGELPSQRITVFMDACFSGTKRGEGMLASARGVAIKSKPEAPKGKMIVFSAAQGDETAYPYEDKQHGLFTYFLLKKLQETKGNITLGELGEYIKQQVSRKSIVTNGKSQTPSVSASTSVEQNWKTLKFK